MPHSLKENQKILSGSTGPTKPLSAAERTIALYKHTCIHCGGLCPCVPETLVAVVPGSVPASGPGTDASTVTVEPSESAQSTASGVGAYSPDELEELEQEEIAWRNANAEKAQAG